MNIALALQEEISSVSDKTVYALNNILVPEDITDHLWNYFKEFMLTKLKMAQLLDHFENKTVDGNELLLKQRQDIERFVSQFSREIKPDLLKKFIEIVQYAHNFGLYYPYYKEETQQLVQDTSVEGYKAIIAAMLDCIPPKKDAFYRLQTFIGELQQYYDVLQSKVREQLADFNENLLANVKRRFQYIDTQLEQTAERLLSSVLTSEDPISLNISSAQDVMETVSPKTKKQQYYIRKYEETLQALNSIGPLQKDLFLFTLVLNGTLNRLAHLAEASKKVDSFWEDSQKNLKALEMYIADNKGRETIQNYLLNYIEVANLDFEFLKDYANQLAANTSIGIPRSRKNYLKFVFLLKDIVVNQK